MDPDVAEEVRKLGRVSALPQSSIDAMRAAGVSPGALAFDADGCLNALFLVSVVFGFGGRFELRHNMRTAIEGEARRAFVWMARDIDGKAVDLVAWSPKTAQVATLWGRVPMLGMEQAGPWYDLAGETLPVHADVEAWFRANRRGVVLFDPRASAPWLHLAAPLMVPTPLEGELLREALTIPAPKIVVGEVRA